MHASMFQLPLYLVLLRTTHAFPQNYESQEQTHQSLQYQAQHPLVVPILSKGERISGTMHMQAALYPHIPVSFTITPTTTPSHEGEMSQLLLRLSNKLRHQFSSGIEIRPNKDVEVSSTARRTGGEAGLYVVFSLVEENGARVDDAVEDVDSEEGARIDRAELGFLVRLFGKAIRDLDEALRTDTRGIENVVLYAEVDGVGMKCEFVMSRDEIGEL
ncbi:hypothetical protein BKA65DRAFT_511941 [Rhexocercosporidium sp. MPI-PUGE-AT-0058]|nr:hypothetical protein BKA65DRAFT_511941 [Rhexocercosporidium sp. MPI-PUGE-AT-0058]